MATVLKNKGNKEKSIPVSSLLSQDGKIHHKRNANDNGDLSNMKVRIKKNHPNVLAQPAAQR